MSTCACPRSELRSVAFAHDIVMSWCARHEVRNWTLNGRQVEQSAVHPALKDLFVEQRGRQHSRPKTTRPRRVQVAATAPSDPQEQLDALLKARGIQGAWAIA